MVESSARVKPRLRGVFHEWALVVAVPLGILLGLQVETARARVAAAIFAASVVVMFGASALYHRPTWSPRWRRWLCSLDHAAIYGLIAGTYTPFGLLVLRGNWRIVVLAIVWSGAGAAVLLKLFWPRSPKWVAAIAGIALGWVGIVVFPQLLSRTGIACGVLVLLGGLLYSVGAAIYALKRPDPYPAVFGYHEIFHLLVVAAVGLQYAAIAFFVLPT
ncbi:MAG: PAQR family membrane homeostasis protein TrhA [Gaiellaceae bacterium]